MSSKKQMRFNCECCGFSSDRKSAYNAHTYTKKHATNLAKKEFQTECVKEQRERELMGLEDVKVKPKKKSKMTVNKYIEIIARFSDMYDYTKDKKYQNPCILHLSWNMPNLRLKRMPIAYYEKEMKILKIDVEKVEKWYKETLPRRNHLLELIKIHNGLSLHILIQHSGLLSDLENQVRIHKLEDPDTIEKLTQQRNSHETKLRERAEKIIRLADMCYGIDDDDLIEDMLNEIVEHACILSDFDVGRDFFKRELSRNYKECRKEWLEITDEEERLSNTKFAIPFRIDENTVEIIKRYYENFTRGFVMK
jgi:hypothetical protein